MGESRTHLLLVGEIIQWVKEQDPDAVIFADSCIFDGCDTPPRVGRHVPDVYARIHSNCQTVLGEAKTRRDLENDHSMSQFLTFLLHCKHNPGTRLVLAVPWEMRRFLHNLFNRLKAETGVSADSVEILHCFTR